MADIPRLTTAQWVFERTVAWIAASEIKVGVVVTLDVAMLVGLSAAFNSAPVKTPWAFLFTAVAAVLLVIAVGCAAAVLFPRLAGPQRSLLFFGRVAQLPAADYAERFQEATEQELLTDWTEQIHRNAQIAAVKHKWVVRAMAWSFAGAVPWLAAILASVKA